jgi:hypothetical protein
VAIEAFLSPALLLVAAFAAGFLFFGFAERRFGLNPKRVRWRVDVLHFFLTPAISRVVTAVAVMTMANRIDYPAWLEDFRNAVPCAAIFRSGICA